MQNYLFKFSDQHKYVCAGQRTVYKKKVKNKNFNCAVLISFWNTDRKRYLRNRVPIYTLYTHLLLSGQSSFGHRDYDSSCLGVLRAFAIQSARTPFFGFLAAALPPPRQVNDDLLVVVVVVRPGLPVAVLGFKNGQVAREEVAVEEELDDTTGDGDALELGAPLEVCVQPVHEVAAPVEAQTRHVRDDRRLDALRLGDEVDLGHDRHGLEVHAERPEDLQRLEAVVDEEGEDRAR